LAIFYHVDIARFAAEADQKWVDNLLSHFDIPGVENSRQGMARRISADAIHHIALVRILNRELGIPTAKAVLLATDLLSSPGAHVAIQHTVEISVDTARFRRHVDAAIAEAVESIAPPRRGRPPSVARRT